MLANQDVTDMSILHFRGMMLVVSCYKISGWKVSKCSSTDAVKKDYICRLILAETLHYDCSYKEDLPLTGAPSMISYFATVSFSLKVFGPGNQRFTEMFKHSLVV